MIVLVVVSLLPAMGLSSAVIVVLTQRFADLQDLRRAEAVGDLTAGIDRWLERALKVGTAAEIFEEATI